MTESLARPLRKCLVVAHGPSNNKGERKKLCFKDYSMIVTTRDRCGLPKYVDAIYVNCDFHQPEGIFNKPTPGRRNVFLCDNFLKRNGAIKIGYTEFYSISQGSCLFTGLAAMEFIISSQLCDELNCIGMDLSDEYLSSVIESCKRHNLGAFPSVEAFRNVIIEILTVIVGMAELTSTKITCNSDSFRHLLELSYKKLEHVKIECKKELDQIREEK